MLGPKVHRVSNSGAGQRRFIECEVWMSGAGRLSSAVKLKQGCFQMGWEWGEALRAALIQSSFPIASKCDFSFFLFRNAVTARF